MFLQVYSESLAGQLSLEHRLDLISRLTKYRLCDGSYDSEDSELAEFTQHLHYPDVQWPLAHANRDHISFNILQRPICSIARAVEDRAALTVILESKFEIIGIHIPAIDICLGVNTHDLNRDADQLGNWAYWLGEEGAVRRN
jgi:hypothetical protein